MARRNIKIDLRLNEQEMERLCQDVARSGWSDIMKRRTIKKQFWFSRDEAQDLQKKAKKTCLTEAALVRLLVRGYEPRERPDERFYDTMRQLSSIGNNINQIALVGNAKGFIDTVAYWENVDWLKKTIHELLEVMYGSWQ